MIDAKPFVQTQLIAVVMDMPSYLSLVVKNTIKQIIEDLSYSIEGVTANIHQRNRFTPLFPEFTLNETSDLAVEQFVTVYLCADTFEMDVMFIEPTPDYTAVRRAWLCSRMKLDSFTSAPATRQVGGPLPKATAVRIRFESLNTTHPRRSTSVSKAAEAIFKQMQVASSNPTHGPRGPQMYHGHGQVSIE